MTTNTEQQVRMAANYAILKSQSKAELVDKARRFQRIADYKDSTKAMLISDIMTHQYGRGWYARMTQGE